MHTPLQRVFRIDEAGVAHPYSAASATATAIVTSIVEGRW